MMISILDFGAKPNEPDLQTDKIQAAIDACFRLGGGEVIIPAGVYNIGGIRLRSNIILHLLENAVLKGSKNPEDYFSYLQDKVEPLPKEFITDRTWIRPDLRKDPDKDFQFLRVAGSRWNNALIRAINAENVSIIGEKGSILDGSDCYDALGEENYRGPHCINMFYCKNITFKGYTVKDSANWAHAIYYSRDIKMDNVCVLAGHDGVHLTACEDITIKNSHFFTGDDCIAGFSNLNVKVHNCELNSACSAFRFGGKNIEIDNCHIYGPCKYLFRGSLTVEEKKNGIKPSLEGHRNNMLSVFTYYADFSFPIEHQPGNIVMKNCRIDYADRLLHFNFSGNETWQSNKPLDFFKFENITVTNLSMPLVAYGDKELPVTIEIENADVSMRKGFENIDFMHICNYKKIKLSNVKVRNFKGNAFIKKWSDGDIELSDVDCGIDDNKRIVPATEKFAATAI